MQCWHLNLGQRGAPSNYVVSTQSVKRQWLGGGGVVGGKCYFFTFFSPNLVLNIFLKKINILNISLKDLVKVCEDFSVLLGFFLGMGKKMVCAQAERRPLQQGSIKTLQQLAEESQPRRNTPPSSRPADVSSSKLIGRWRSHSPSDLLLREPHDGICK